MKFLLLLICFIPLSSEARRVVTFAAGLEAITNGVSPEISCEEAIANGGPIPAHCQDLFTSVCSNRPQPRLLNAMDQKIVNATYGSLAATATQAQRNVAATDAVRMADEEAYDTSLKDGPSRDDIRRMMDPARWNIVNIFNGVGYPSAARQRQMATTVQNVRLKTGTEYVTSLIEWGRSQNPSASAEVLRRDAITTYTSACGRTGLEVNAFYEEGEIVLCPGLVVSMRDYPDSPNRNEEIKAAMIFTMSHEVSHSIDYLTNPSDFDRLIACYQQTSPDPSILSDRNKLAELTSDYFGAYSLGKYLTESGNHVKLGTATPVTPTSANIVLRILARSLGGLCAHDPNDTDHPNSRYRMNQIVARTPGIKSALGCPAPTAADPSCSLRGRVPAQ